MASRKPSRKKKADLPAGSSKGCMCGGDCHDPHSALPGYYLIALGLMAVPLNLGMLPGMEWAKAWPLLFSLFGFVLVVKSLVCKRVS